MTDDLSGLPAGLLDPIAEYDHDEGRAVVGGFVYRGSAIPELVGKYVFGDFPQSGSLGRLFALDLESFEIEELVIGFDDRDLEIVVKGFGVDAAGELYVAGNTSATRSDLEVRARGGGLEAPRQQRQAAGSSAANKRQLSGIPLSS